MTDLEYGSAGMEPGSNRRPYRWLFFGLLNRKKVHQCQGCLIRINDANTREEAITSLAFNRAIDLMDDDISLSKAICIEQRSICQELDLWSWEGRSRFKKKEIDKISKVTSIDSKRVSKFLFFQLGSHTGLRCRKQQSFFILTLVSNRGCDESQPSLERRTHLADVLLGFLFNRIAGKLVLDVVENVAKAIDVPQFFALPVNFVKHSGKTRTNIGKHQSNEDDDCHLSEKPPTVVSKHLLRDRKSDIQGVNYMSRAKSTF